MYIHVYIFLIEQKGLCTDRYRYVRIQILQFSITNPSSILVLKIRVYFPFV